LVTTTIWVLGDQLNRSMGALATAQPGQDRVLLVHSTNKLASKRWHRQRAHLIVTAMRRFALELRAEGFDVDEREATSFRSGLAAHQKAFKPSRVVAMESANFAGNQMLIDLGVEVVRSDQFLCHRDDFATFAAGRKSLKMEDFYRWQRRRLGYLMDGDEPAEGRWNFDEDNREPPPKTGHDRWATPPKDALDDLDRSVLAGLPASCWGADPNGTWATDRAGALRRLDHFITHGLPLFGPHEDAMLINNWHLAHSLLSPYVNLGLLLPAELCDAAEDAYRSGQAPIASVEGFIRQVIGWREYVHGVYWLWGPEYRHANSLEATRPLPPVFLGAKTDMRCVSSALGSLHDRGYMHHIQRLMVIGNLSMLAGVDPWALTEWMWAGFVDGAEWVMLPNVIGMSQHADGGKMATKPYAAGGAYVDKMSDSCKGCRYDRKQRVGPDACPFTTLYWDFLARHSERFGRNPRIVQQVRAAQKLSDLPAVQQRAAEVLTMLDAGQL
jgi:deoxyribodipyrimidine photolyase-related protein